MPGPKPFSIELQPCQREALKRITRRHLAPQNLLHRVRIVLEASQGRSNTAIAKRLATDRDTAAIWRRRYTEAQPDLEEASSEKLSEAIEPVLADRPRSGAPPTFSPEEVAQIMALACRDPEETGRPISRWTPGELADEAQKQVIVSTISARTVGHFLKGGGSAPSRRLLTLVSRAHSTTLSQNRAPNFFFSPSYYFWAYANYIFQFCSGILMLSMRIKVREALRNCANLEAVV